MALLGVAVDARGDLRLVEESIEEFAADEKAVKSLLSEADRRRNDKLRPMAGSEAFGVAIVCLEAKDFKQADLFFEASIQQTRDKSDQRERQLTWAEEAFFADHLPAARKYFAAALKDPSEETDTGSVTELLAMPTNSMVPPTKPSTLSTAPWPMIRIPLGCLHDEAGFSITPSERMRQPKRISKSSTDLPTTTVAKRSDEL